MVINISPDLAKYEAREHDGYSCPIATSINKHLAKGYKAYVTEVYFRIFADEDWPVVSQLLGYQLSDWIRRYDMGLVQPTDVTFSLNVPEEYLA